MFNPGSKGIKIRSLQAIVALADNKFCVNDAANDLGIEPQNFSALITRLVHSSDVEIFTHYSHTTGKRSKVNGFTFAGYEILLASRQLLKPFGLNKR